MEELKDVRDVEFDAQIVVLSELADTDGGKALDDYLGAKGIPEQLAIAISGTFIPYALAHPEYLAKFDARVKELAEQRGITITEDPITPGCKCGHCELQRARGAKDPMVTQKVFVPNLEQDAQMAACAQTESNEVLEKLTESFGLTVDEAIIRGKRLAVYLLDNPDYQAALDKRVDEIVAEKKAGVSVSASSAEKIQVCKNIGLDPTPEVIAYLNELAEDAMKGGPLSKAYVDAGAIVVSRVDIEVPVIGNVSLATVGFSKTKFKPIYDGGASSLCNN